MGVSVKKIAFSLVSILLASFQALADNTPAIEAHGILKWGHGPCVIKVVKAPYDVTDSFYEVSITTDNYRFNFVNQTLDDGYFNQATEYFEKENDGYHMIVASLSPIARLHKVTLTNLSNNSFKIQRTLLLFGVSTVSISNICLIQN